MWRFDTVPRRTAPKGQQSFIYRTAPRPRGSTYIKLPSAFVTHETGTQQSSILVLALEHDDDASPQPARILSSTDAPDPLCERWRLAWCAASTVIG
jgi:hypothetical protein